MISSKALRKSLWLCLATPLLLFDAAAAPASCRELEPDLIMVPVEFRCPVAEPGLAELDPPARLPTESPLEALRDATRPVRPAIARLVTDPKL